MPIDPNSIRDLIVKGAGNRRVFRMLLAGACQHACDTCPMRSQGRLPLEAREPARLARLFVSAFRRGWCDGLFLMSGLPKDPVDAMERMLSVVSLLRFTYGYRGYLHVKALEGAEPGQIERLVRLVDRVSYGLELSCLERRDGVIAVGHERSGTALTAPDFRVGSAIYRPRRRGIPAGRPLPHTHPAPRPASRFPLLPPHKFVRRFVQPALFEIPANQIDSSGYNSTAAFGS
jgi:hypothetical protein